jgi:hypothetical protein
MNDESIESSSQRHTNKVTATTMNNNNNTKPAHVHGNDQYRDGIQQCVRWCSGWTCVYITAHVICRYIPHIGLSTDRLPITSMTRIAGATHSLLVCIHLHPFILISFSLSLSLTHTHTHTHTHTQHMYVRAQIVNPANHANDLSQSSIIYANINILSRDTQYTRTK